MFIDKRKLLSEHKKDKKDLTPKRMTAVKSNATFSRSPILL